MFTTGEHEPQPIGVVRRRGGSRHPGLPEELIAARDLAPRGPSGRGGGEVRREEAPFPRLLAERPPRPRSRSGDGLVAAGVARCTACTVSRDEIVREPRRRSASASSGPATERGATRRRSRSWRRRRRSRAEPDRAGWSRPGSRRSGRTTSASCATMHGAVPGARWHYIGALQTSTAHHVAALADVVETRLGRPGDRAPRPACRRGRPRDRRADRGRLHGRASGRGARAMCRRFADARRRISRASACAA